MNEITSTPNVTVHDRRSTEKPDFSDRLISTDKTVLENVSDVKASKVTEFVVQTKDSKDIKDERESEEKIASAVERINSFIHTMQRDLNFSVDEESGQRVVTVTDRSTNEVVRQLPSEEALEIMTNLDKISGLLFSSKV
jgi:flagellar protein FlaG